jgi:hypothetical protein
VFCFYFDFILPYFKTTKIKMDTIKNPSKDNSSDNNQTDGNSIIPEKSPDEDSTNSELGNTNEENSNNEILPRWAYGAIAGGVAVIGIAGALTYRKVSRNRMVNRAKADAKELYMRQEANMTPRNDFTPRDGDKPLDNPPENQTEKQGLL